MEKRNEKGTPLSRYTRDIEKYSNAVKVSMGCLIGQVDNETLCECNDIIISIDALLDKLKTLDEKQTQRGLRKAMDEIERE